MASGSGSSPSPLHIFEPSSVNVSSDGDSVPEVNEIYDPRYPLWKYVKKIENNGPDGGNAVIECTFCGKQISDSYTRIRAHLLKIPNQDMLISKRVTVPILGQLRKEVADADEAISNSKPKNVPLPVQIGQSTGLPSSGGTSGQSKGRKRQSGIDESIFCERRQIANALVGRMFYTGGMELDSLKEF
jgi:hypothetical protein